MGIIYYYILSCGISSPFSIGLAVSFASWQLPSEMFDLGFHRLDLRKLLFSSLYGRWQRLESSIISILFCLCCFGSLLLWLPTQTVIFDYTLDTVLGKLIVMMI